MDHHRQDDPTPTTCRHASFEIEGATSTLLVVRMLCLVAALVAAATAWIADLTFVERVILGREVLDLRLASALPAARVLLALAGAGLFLFAVFLPRILEAKVVHRFLRSPRQVALALFALPIVLLVLVLLDKLAFGKANPLYLLLMKEDSVFEYLTALIFLIAFILAAGFAHALLRAGERLLGPIFAALALALLFIALEEISYGQRIFGFATPAALAGQNLQEEVNLHNLASMKSVFFLVGPIAVGLGGGLGWLLLPCCRRLPLLLARVAVHVVPPWFAASYFLPVALYWGLHHLLGQRSGLIWQDQELVEFLLACGFLVLVTNARQRWRAEGGAGAPC